MKLFTNLISMIHIFGIKATSQIFIFLFIISTIVFFSCSDQGSKDFNWVPKVAEITGKDLESWLRKTPYQNELKNDNENEFVITNVEQVFPFMNKFNNDIGPVNTTIATTDTIIYEQKHLIFQDPVWGDVFVSGTLLYDDEELFLEQSSNSTGNPFFGGVEASGDIYSSTLYETSVQAKHDDYKTGLYWADANSKVYLFGFYQQGQLVFEAVVPLLGSDTAAAINKLGEINKKLNLNIPEWENVSSSALRVNDDPKTFWNDPYVGLYMNEYTMDQVYLKTKNTKLELAKQKEKGDYYFSYQVPQGLVELYTELKPITQNEAEFNKANAKQSKYLNGPQQIFYDEQSSGNFVQGIAKTYTKDNKYLELHYSFPEKDEEARKTVHDILKYIKIFKY